MLYFCPISTVGLLKSARFPESALISLAEVIMSTVSLVVALLEKVSLVLVVLYLLERAGFFRRILRKDFNLGNQAFLVIVFGALSLYGTYSGVKLTSGTIVNIREMAPMAAGLVAGPVVGILVGLIGGIHRYFQGGLTALPCAISTTVAGLAAGVIFVASKKGLVVVWGAAAFAVLMEAAAMGLIMLLARPYADAWQAVQVIALPMILANAAGVTIFVFMMKSVIKEKYL